MVKVGPREGPRFRGGGGSKGTTNWLETAHSAIRPRARMQIFWALGVPPNFEGFPPQCRLPGGMHPFEGAFFFNTLRTLETKLKMTKTIELIED